ncbi:ABC transporter permease [Spirochaetia bacterium]|nr:ABC transporter permease [Spirochaetia bacterium]
MKNSESSVVWLKDMLAARESIMVIVIAILFVLMSFISPYFLLPQTMLNLLMSLTVEGIIAIGMAILLVSGGMDLSAGANMALSGVVAALFYVTGHPLWQCVTVGLSCGLIVGVVNGLLISFVGLNPFICTLGMQMALQGLMLIITNGKAVQVTGDFAVIGSGKLLGIPYPVYILVILVILFDVLLRKSKALRQSYYVGGNENAAKLNGINVKAVKVFNYALVGVLAALAGIILASRFTTASVTVGGNTALNVLTACIIGGASLKGGEGTVLGGFLGVLFISMLSTSFNIMDVNTFIKTFVTGLILIAAITIDVLNERRKISKLSIEAQKRMDTSEVSKKRG